MEFKVTPLSERAMSSFALSIGTALALESVFKGTQPAYDPLRQIPEHLNINDYDELLVNVETLVRNIYSSVPSAVQKELDAADLYITLESEIDILRSLVEEGSHGKTKIVFYVTDKSRIPTLHPHAKVKLDVTARQLSYTAITELVVKEFLKRHSHTPGVIRVQELLAPVVKTKALILTHDAYDLLSWPAFKELHLLESHTGLMKKRALWYTKYHNGKELMRIPFNACFMQVFGDSVNFHPFPLKDRLVVKNIADERGWTTLTTKDRLVYSFQQMPDRALAGLLLEMLSE